MGIVFRQSVKTTIVTFWGALLGAFINWVLTFTLTKPEIGIVTNLLYLGAIFQFLVTLGTGHSILTYISRYDDDRKRKALISFAFIITLLAAFVFSVVYFLLKDTIISKYQIPDRPFLYKYYFWVPVLTLLWAFSTLFEMYLLSHSKAAIPAFLREVVLRVFNILTLGLYYYNYISFDAFIAVTILTYIIPTVISWYFASKHEDFGFSFDLKVFSRAEYRELLHFSWYHLLLGTSMNIMGYIDSLMLAPLDKDGMASLATYRIATFIISAMVIPYKALSNASFAVLNRTYGEGEPVALANIFHRTATNMFIVTSAMFVLIACNLDNAVAILNKGYDDVKPLVLILMLGRLIDISTGMNNELISISKYYKFNFRLSLLLLVMVFILNRIFIPKYGVFGAAWSSTAAFIIFNIVKTLFLYHKMKLQPYNRHTVAIIIAAIVAGTAGYFLPYLVNPVVDTLIRSSCILLIYAAVLLWLKPSQDLNDYLRSVKESKRLF